MRSIDQEPPFFSRFFHFFPLLTQRMTVKVAAITLAGFAR
jgi:hypothetical protein